MPLPHDQWRRHIAQIDARDPARPMLPPLAATPAAAPSAAQRERWRAEQARIAAEDAQDALLASEHARPDLHPDFNIGEAIAPTLSASRRADGWTAARQRAFCELIATGVSIEHAARAQGLSASSAYGFRNSAKGAAFNIGWTAAHLLQRQRLADTVSARVFDGQTVTITRPDGSTVERHFHDNRLAMNVLARLDRIAAAQGSDTTPENQAARLAAAEWDRFLDIMGDGPARAGLFLAARTDGRDGAPEVAAIGALARADLYARTGAGTLAEVDVGDLDPAARARWTAEQWARAEAAGLLVLAPATGSESGDGAPQHSQHSPDADADEPVWWCEEAEAWRTSFPPPEDFDGEEEGRYGDEDYARELTEDEEDAADARAALETPAAAAARIAHVQARDAWFATRAPIGEPSVAGPAAPDTPENAAPEPQAEDATAAPDPVAPPPAPCAAAEHGAEPAPTPPAPSAEPMHQPDRSPLTEIVHADDWTAGPADGGSFLSGAQSGWQHVTSLC